MHATSLPMTKDEIKLNEKRENESKDQNMSKMLKDVGRIPSFDDEDGSRKDKNKNLTPP